MEWSDIWKIILGVIASAGGIGGIIVIGIKFSANMIAERLSQKYEIKLQKELEKYKSGLDNKIYISKAKFDTEFTLYRELSSVFFNAVKAIIIMIPAGYATYPADKKDREEYENELYFNAKKVVVEAQDVLNGNTPFLPENFYGKYDEILGLCKCQLGVFEKRWNVLYSAAQREKESFDREDYERSREIKEKFDALNKEIREYLSKIDILD